MVELLPTVFLSRHSDFLESCAIMLYHADYIAMLVSLEIC